MINFSSKNNQRPLHDLVAGFEDGTLPREEWTHAAHLTVALWYLVHYPTDDDGEAVRRIRDGIKHYNAAVGVVSTPTSGYHETLTLFYIRAMKRFVETATSGLPTESLVEMMLESDIAKREYPLRFYTKELLFSPEARAMWAEPDICALD